METQSLTGILLISFGTSHSETRKKTIEAMEQEIRSAFPQYPVFHAWTSPRIISKLKKLGDIIPTPQEALKKMLEQGIRRVLVQPTYILNAIENQLMKDWVNDFADKFDAISFGTPLLTSETDFHDVLQAVKQEFFPLDTDTALVLMGHGSEHPANITYKQLQDLCTAFQYPNIFVGTVEASPSLDDILTELKSADYRHVILAPLMLVAGDHAVNDMAGESPTSWKNRLLAKGYSVTPVLKGLGEYPDIRNIFIKHAREALNRLNLS